MVITFATWTFLPHSIAQSNFIILTTSAWWQHESCWDFSKTLSLFPLKCFLSASWSWTIPTTTALGQSSSWLSIYRKSPRVNCLHPLYQHHLKTQERCLMRKVSCSKKPLGDLYFRLSYLIRGEKVPWKRGKKT